MIRLGVPSLCAVTLIEAWLDKHNASSTTIVGAAAILGWYEWSLMDYHEAAAIIFG
jgi:hypothetical protein